MTALEWVHYETPNLLVSIFYDFKVERSVLLLSQFDFAQQEINLNTYIRGEKL